MRFCFLFLLQCSTPKEIAAGILDGGSIHWQFLLKKKNYFWIKPKLWPPKKEMNALLFFFNALPVRKLLQKFQTEGVFTDTSSWKKKIIFGWNLSSDPPKTEMNALLFFCFFPMLYPQENCCRNFRRREYSLTLPLEKKNNYFWTKPKIWPPKKEMNALLFFSNALPLRKMLQKFQTEGVFTDTSSWNKK